MKNKLTVFDQEELKDISPILMSVYQFLGEKAMFEMKPQDENNRTVLGGVGFFFKEHNKEYMLCYDKHPKYWNETEINEDIEQYKKYIYKQKGVFIED